MPEMMELQFAACEGDPFHLDIWGPNTQDSLHNASQRLLTKWRNDPFLPVVKCVEDMALEGAAAANTSLPKSTIMGFCLWDMFQKRTVSRRMDGRGRAADV
jgi:hypothetical protein